MARELNACGFSSETIAAEYETDAALHEAGLDMDDPYFRAALAAETEQRTIDHHVAAGVEYRDDCSYCRHTGA